MTQKKLDPKLKQLIKQNAEEKKLLKRMAESFSSNRFGPLVFLLIFGAIGALLTFNSFAATDSGKTDDTPARLWLWSDRSFVPIGDTITIQLWSDNGGKQVNAMMMGVSYPSDKLQYVTSDTPENNHVETRVINTGEKVVVTRVGNDEQSGEKWLTSLVFRAKAAGDVSLDFDDISEVRQASDSADILGTTDGLQFTVTE